MGRVSADSRNSRVESSHDSTRLEFWFWLDLESKYLYLGQFFSDFDVLWLYFAYFSARNSDLALVFHSGNVFKDEIRLLHLYGSVLRMAMLRFVNEIHAVFVNMTRLELTRLDSSFVALWLDSTRTRIFLTRPIPNSWWKWKGLQKNEGLLSQNKTWLDNYTDAGRLVPSRIITGASL